MLVVLGVLALAFIAAGAGFWIWHEQPSFCSAICHTPMDPYGRTYEFSSGAPGEDKWGNEVPDAGAMMVVTHKEAGEDCMACHVPSLGEQITEGLTWITGNYEYPLNERNLKNLVEARGIPADEFCLNDRCHHVTADGAALQTRDDLFAMTDEYTRNPHKPQHGENECGLCHKAHRASVNYCSQCHGDAPIPDGWLTHMQAQKLDRP
ncbi:MAG: cytochrome c3 family protein [Eggerthellaceae bacterium]|nr:cytochrome c3 family protein [Eggerthellaceae bacterium]